MAPIPESPASIPEAPTPALHIDPVCKMTVREGSEAGKWEYKGNDYYFCSVNCLKRFQAEPERFLKMAETAGGGSHEGMMESEETLPEPVSAGQGGAG